MKKIAFTLICSNTNKFLIQVLYYLCLMLFVSQRQCKDRYSIIKNNAMQHVFAQKASFLDLYHVCLILKAPKSIF